ncbi:CDC27 protein [Tilletia horrida]|uniref:DNA polymerase delta subunit 3 n=1 Tax=Tilletia horrida TaxID=155126 RepID=A0AAN6GEQ1_9BASI|nr:CDC27 protein [Tilletia horrida]
MADNLDDFLAGWVLSDAKLITYRLLSRARNMHVQDAKAALQDFYVRTSSKKPLALSAIYVLKGTLKTEQDGVPAYQRSRDQDGDVAMTDEPGPSQPASQSTAAAVERVSKKQLLLVSADRLEATKALYASLTTAHIYSLAPGPDANAAKRDDDQTVSDALTEAARKQVPLLSTAQQDLHSTKEYMLAWEKAQRGRALGVIWNSSIVEDFSPDLAPVARSAAAGPSGKKTEAPAKYAKSESNAPVSKAAQAKTAPVKTAAAAAKGAASKAALENMLFPKSEAEPAKKVAPAPSAKAESKKEDVKGKRTASGAQKRSAPEAQGDDAEDEEQGKDKALGSGGKGDGQPRAKKRVKKTRTVTKSERFKDERGYTVRRNVEVEEEYTTDEASDDGRPKPTKVVKKRSSAAAAASTSRKKSASPVAEAEPSPSPPPVSEPAPAPAPAAPTKSAPAAGKAKTASSSSFGNKAGGSGSGGAGAGAKKSVDKRQQTLGSFFKKKA